MAIQTRLDHVELTLSLQVIGVPRCLIHTNDE